MRNALPVRATVSIGKVAACGGPIAVERTAENRERCPRRIAIKRKELLVERHKLGRWLIGRSGYGVHPTARQLLQHILLKWRRRPCRAADDRERNPNPFGVEKEKQLFLDDRASETPAEVIHRGAWLVVSGCGVRKEISGIELRAVPKLIQVSVKPIRTGFRDIVDLSGAVPALIDCVGDGVYGHLSDRIQPQYQIGRKPAVQIGQRIVGFQSIHDISVGERWQAIKLDVAIAVGARSEERRVG